MSAAMSVIETVPGRTLRQVPAGEELGELYVRHADDLRRLVRSNLTLSDDLLDDACQFAWSQLLVMHSQLAAGVELGWLTTTATREALRLLREQRRILTSVESAAVAVCGDGDSESAALVHVGPRSGSRAPSHRSLSSDPDVLVELRDRLWAVSALPPRQRQFLWLHGIGYEYAEISAATGASRRTVQRQLQRARRTLRD